MVNDIVVYMKIALVIVVAFFMYVFITHGLNEAICTSLANPGSQIAGKGVMRFLALCWWY